MTALSPRRIGLLLLLDALGLGVPKTYDDRRTVQAAVYIAKATGLDLGHRYGWYVYAPWSPTLHDDLEWLAGRCATTDPPTPP